jgi:hypothetical protein
VTGPETQQDHDVSYYDINRRHLAAREHPELFTSEVRAAFSARREPQPRAVGVSAPQRQCDLLEVIQDAGIA